MTTITYDMVKTLQEMGATEKQAKEFASQIMSQNEAKDMFAEKRQVSEIEKSIARVEVSLKYQQ